VRQIAFCFSNFTWYI